VCGLTAATLLATGACGGGKSKSASGQNGASSGGAAASSAPQATPQSVAQAFLTAWGSGDFNGAGALTDTPDTATTRLKNVMGSLSPKTVTLTLGSQENTPAGADSAASPSGSGSGASSPASPASGAAPAALARFDFTVADDFGNNLVWNYSSKLDIVQGPSGAPVVRWTSAVINPSLGGTALLKAMPPKQTIADYKGNPIDTTAHPTLAGAVGALATHVQPGTTPTALNVEFIDPKTNKQVPQSQSFPLGTSSGPAPTIKTTIDPSVQSAIEAALNKYPDSGMVAIQPSTGDILGMASHSTASSTLAYWAARAPGSTFKVITTALALQQGLKTTDQVKCTANAVVEGKPISNDSGLANGIQGATLKDAFEQSCNTAFVNLALDGKLGSDYSALANEAKTYFGMDQKWDLGMGPATYGTAGDSQVKPADGPGLFARDAFGQGDISMSPLTMASVAATICAGKFNQPILVPGTQTVTATPLPADVDAQLTTLMKGVASASDGTAYGIFPGISGIAAKTGSAESNDTPKTHKTDSWMIVFDKSRDIAFAALVLNGGFGRDAAGPAIDTAMVKLGIH
jgi:hypothetical protein